MIISIVPPSRAGILWESIEGTLTSLCFLLAIGYFTNLLWIVRTDERRTAQWKGRWMNPIYGNPFLLTTYSRFCPCCESIPITCFVNAYHWTVSNSGVLHSMGVCNKLLDQSPTLWDYLNLWDKLEEIQQGRNHETNYNCTYILPYINSFLSHHFTEIEFHETRKVERSNKNWTDHWSLGLPSSESYSYSFTFIILSLYFSSQRVQTSQLVG